MKLTSYANILIKDNDYTTPSQEKEEAKNLSKTKKK